MFERFRQMSEGFREVSDGFRQVSEGFQQVSERWILAGFRLSAGFWGDISGFFGWEVKSRRGSPMCSPVLRQ